MTSWEVDTIATDGSDRVHLTVTPSFVRAVDWQPLPVNTASAYARPKAATPTYLPLVPAYGDCTTPNRQHGGGLTSARVLRPTTFADADDRSG